MDKLSTTNSKTLPTEIESNTSYNTCVDHTQKATRNISHMPKIIQYHSEGVEIKLEIKLYGKKEI